MIRKYLLITGLIAAMLLIGIAAPTLNGQVAAQDAGANGVADVQADVGATFTYQGFLQKDSVAASGTCDFEFKLYDAATGGTQIGGTQTRTGTSVTEGRFTVELDFGPAAFNGQARWLEISVRCPAGSGSYTTLSPRQPLTPAPYANSLRPGATVNGTVNGGGGVLNLTNSGNGAGLTVDSANNGIYVATATETGMQVDSAKNGFYVATATGNGLTVGSANNGAFVVQAAQDGLYVCATGNKTGCIPKDGVHNGVEVGNAQDSGFWVNEAGRSGMMVEAAGEDGVRVIRAEGDGVKVDEAGGNGLSVGAANNHGLNVSSATGNGVQIGSATIGVQVDSATFGYYVTNATETGLTVETAKNGVYVATVTGNGLTVDSSENGVYVVNAATDGVHIEKAGDVGVLVEEAVGGFEANSVTNNGFAVASANTGIYVVGPVTNWAGYFTGNVNVTGTCTGCVLATMAVNSGDSALQPGDVVALQGSRAAAISGQSLMMEVERASGGAPLVGVVHGRGELTEAATIDGQTETQIVPRAGVAQPGDYVHIVIYGQAQVKASALDGAIALGQKLAVADDGAARSLKTVEVDGVQLAESASTIGMALEDSASRVDGLIWVLVNPQ